MSELDEIYKKDLPLSDRDLNLVVKHYREERVAFLAKPTARKVTVGKALMSDLNLSADDILS